MFPRRPGRLKGISYRGPYRYFLTSCTSDRHNAFEDDTTARNAIEQLRESAKGHGFDNAAYCFMPDHAHVLACGTTAEADLQAFMVHFKKLTGHDYRQRTRRYLWQSGYYDHVLRSDQTTERVAKYILENPIRAGLAKVIGEYPYAGSDVFDVKLL